MGKNFGVRVCGHSVPHWEDKVCDIFGLWSVFTWFDFPCTVQPCCYTELFNYMYITLLAQK